MAKKEYWEKAKQLLKIQISTLKQFDDDYDETALEQLYDNFPIERKQLIEPLMGSARQKLKEWNEETYEPYNAYPEYKIY